MAMTPTVTTHGPGCRGRFERKLVTAEHWWGGTLSLVENVPALVCDECGEQFYELDVARRLDEFHERPPKPERIIEVPVYDYNAKS